jgi:hypothetical protein
MLEQQFTELMAHYNADKTKVPTHILNLPLFSEIVRKVSKFALAKIYTQYQALQGDAVTAPCIGVFTRKWGLPCKHTLKQLERFNCSVTLDHIIQHWHLRDVSIEDTIIPQLLPSRHTHNTIQAPDVRKPKGRSKGALNKVQRYRDPSGHEYVEEQYSKKRPRQCSNCHETGHTRDKCFNSIAPAAGIDCFSNV